MCLYQLGVFPGCIRLHPLNLHFPRYDLRAERCGRFAQGTRLVVELHHSCGLFCLLQCLFGVGQIHLCLLELLLEEEPALGGFCDGEVLRQVAQLVDVAVGEFSGAAWIAIHNRDADQATRTAAVHFRMALENFARIGEMLHVVLLHQAEMLRHSVFNSAALQQCDESVVGVLDAETAASQCSYTA